MRRAAFTSPYHHTSGHPFETYNQTTRNDPKRDLKALEKLARGGAGDSDSGATPKSKLLWAEHRDTDAELGDTDGDWVFRANAGDPEKRFWHNTRTEETRWTIKRAGE